MNPPSSVQDVIDELARDPLPHIILLKQLLAYPEHVKVHRISDSTGAATLVLLETSVSSYDRETYPRAAVAAFIASDHPELTTSLMSRSPWRQGRVQVVTAATGSVEAQFAVGRRTAFVSFTTTRPIRAGRGRRITSEPSDSPSTETGT